MAEATHSGRGVTTLIDVVNSPGLGSKFVLSKGDRRRLSHGGTNAQRMDFFVSLGASGREIEILDRINRIEVNLSHARLIQQAGSALKTQSRQGRGIEEFLTTEYAKITKGPPMSGKLSPELKKTKRLEQVKRWIDAYSAEGVDWR